MFKFILLSIIAISTTIHTPESVPVKPGSYPVRIYYEGEVGAIDQTINVTVGSENYVVENDIAIDANDFEVSYQEQLTDQNLITSAGAKAWNTKTNESYRILKTATTKVDDSNYQVTFETILGVSTTVKMKVITKEEMYSELVANNNGSLVEIKVLDGFLQYTLIGASIILGIIIIVLICYMQYGASKRVKEISLFLGH